MTLHELHYMLQVSMLADTETGLTDLGGEATAELHDLFVDLDGSPAST